MVRSKTTKTGGQAGAVIVGVIIAVALLGIGIFFLIGLLFGIVYKYADGPCSGTKQFIARIILTGFSQTAYDTYCIATKGAGAGGGGLAAGDCVASVTGKNWSCTDKPNTKATATSDHQSVTYFFDGGQYTFRDGSAAWRNNNPGNITKSAKAIGQNGPFVIFPDYNTGYQAIGDLLATGTGNGKRYSTLSIYDAIYTYAPPSQNDSAGYVDKVRKLTGLDVDRIVGDLNADELKKVVDAITVVEGYDTGKIISAPDLCTEDVKVEGKQESVQICTSGGVIRSGNAIVLNVPWELQGDGTQFISGWCGDASQQMVLNFLAPGRKTCLSQTLCKLSSANFDQYGYQCSNTDHDEEVAAAIKSIVDPAIAKPVIIYTDVAKSARNLIGHHIFVLVGYDPSLNPTQGGTFYINDTYGKEEVAKQSPKVGGIYATAEYIKAHIHPQACDMIIRKDAFNK